MPDQHTCLTPLPTGQPPPDGCLDAADGEFLSFGQLNAYFVPCTNTAQEALPAAHQPKRLGSKPANEPSNEPPQSVKNRTVTTDDTKNTFGHFLKQKFPSYFKGCKCAGDLVAVTGRWTEMPDDKKIQRVARTIQFRNKRLSLTSIKRDIKAAAEEFYDGEA